ncbi:hypothetical protein [Bradyrhizobium sp. SZCCHNR2026]|uniref:hypothetical protein n=1 Tax=Bradyrhizobium sp. SZCCHNR2026 TaxID=3057381 RepID=UPI0029168E9F|nr:hypothetical protein [Bradyrhizobium sp. SZCCHNR2026]
MAQLTIGDKTISIDDGFLKLSPEQQNATVQEIAGQIGAGAAPAPAPVTANSVARAAATGVPIIGGALNKLDAATNAALAPMLNRFFAPEDQLPEATFSERYAHSLRDQEGADKRFAADHPVIDTGAQIAGNIGSMVVPMSAAPKAFGLVGSLPQMVRNGAISGGALAAADAAVRGENPIDAAGVGAAIGGVAGPIGKGVGKVAAAIADRVNPAAPVAQNLVDVGGVKIPLTMADVTQDPALSAEQQIILRGGRGEAARRTGQAAIDARDSAALQARDNIGAGLNPNGAGALPQDAAERIAAELIAKEQAQQAADAANAAQVGREGQALARSFDAGGQMRAPTAFDAGETLSAGFAAARDASKANYRGKYAKVDEQPGEFAPGSAAGFRNDVEAGLASADRPVSQLDPTNHGLSLKALDVIDRRLNAVGPGRPGVAADLGAEHAQNVADIRAKYGDQVASAYDRQKAAPKAQSLLEFLASKGGLGPDAELEAIGAHSHVVNVEGAGRRKLVRQGGWPLDYAREAAQEAGYLRSAHPDQTSTTNDLLDAIDAEIRGRKTYPDGFEGYKTQRELSARSEREQHDYERHIQGLQEDLAAAGHGELGADVRKRAVDLMARDGLDADTAVEHALAQLEQEDAAGLGGFPGDRSAAPAVAPKAAKQKLGSSFTMRDVEQVRKELVTLYGDARRRMMAGGSGSDVHALEHIMDQFGARVEQMVQEGKFSGDGPGVLQMQREARAAFADYKEKFSRRGSGDAVGAAVEKILGRFSDTAATPDTVVKLAYGDVSRPGGQMPVQIAQRIISIFGRNSPEFAAYKQGLFAHLMEGGPEKAAARINEFLNGTKGKLLAQTVFDGQERAALALHADRQRSTLPRSNDPGAAAVAIRRYTGADGAPPASPQKIINDLMGANGKGTGVHAPLIAQGLKKQLSPESWNSLRQLAFRELTDAGEGKIPFEAQALSQRLHEFLNESGSQLAQVLYSPKELDLMRKLAAVYKQMIPVKGTTNPSGTAPMLARMAGGLRQTLLPLLGLTHGGLPGAAAAYAADKAVTAVGNLNAAHNARGLFYGPQAVRPANDRLMLASGLRGQAAIQQSNEDRRRSK